MSEAVARMELLIRRDVATVFNAFVDPAIITRFWFDRTTGPLAPGATVTWFWDRYDASADVRVLEFEPNEHLLIEWDSGTDHVATVDWTFEAIADRGTAVRVVERGAFDVDPAKAIDQVADSTGGFALVLAAAKALLEHGVELNIVADRP